MPRPFPGGRSTCVGNVSRSGELKVPTYATSGPAALPDCVCENDPAAGDIPTSAADAFRNDRREGLRWVTYFSFDSLMRSEIFSAIGCASVPLEPAPCE